LAVQNTYQLHRLQEKIPGPTEHDLLSFHREIVQVFVKTFSTFQTAAVPFPHLVFQQIGKFSVKFALMLQLTGLSKPHRDGLLLLTAKELQCMPVINAMLGCILVASRHFTAINCLQFGLYGL